jgi:hypothetical protein
MPVVSPLAHGHGERNSALTIDQASPVFAFLKKYRTGTIHMTISYLGA